MAEETRNKWRERVLALSATGAGLIAGHEPSASFADTHQRDVRPLNDAHTPREKPPLFVPREEAPPPRPVKGPGLTNAELFGALDEADRKKKELDAEERSRELFERLEEYSRQSSIRNWQKMLQPERAVKKYLAETDAFLAEMLKPIDNVGGFRFEFGVRFQGDVSSVKKIRELLVKLSETMEKKDSQKTYDALVDLQAELHQFHAEFPLPASNEGGGLALFRPTPFPISEYALSEMGYTLALDAKKDMKNALGWGLGEFPDGDPSAKMGGFANFLLINPFMALEYHADNAWLRGSGLDTSSGLDYARQIKAVVKELRGVANLPREERGKQAEKHLDDLKAISKKLQEDQRNDIKKTRDEELLKQYDERVKQGWKTPDVQLLDMMDQVFRKYFEPQPQLRR